jgi:hypothetical protein
MNREESLYRGMGEERPGVMTGLGGGLVELVKGQQLRLDLKEL